VTPRASKTALSWSVRGYGESLAAHMALPGGEADIAAAVAICAEECRLMEEAIAADQIPFPNRIPKEQPVFGPDVHREASGPGPQWTAAPVLDEQAPAVTPEALRQAVQAVLGDGEIVVVGADAELLAAAGRPITVLDPGYGAASVPIAEGLLQRPAPGSFFAWLTGRGGTDGVGAVVFCGDLDWTAELVAWLDAAAEPPPAFVWNPETGILRRLRAETPAGPWPRVSIITPSYNQAAFIEATILSVLDQNYPNLEFIIVDGGSTDGSVDIIERYRHRLAAVVIEPDEGQSDAINKGFAMATGEVMNWLCSDDLLEPGALFNIARAYMRDRPDLIAGGCARIGMSRDEEFFRHHTAVLLGPSAPLDPLDILKFMQSWQTGPYFFQPEVFFSRRIWLASGGFVKRHLFYVMDYDLWLRMAFAGASIRHVPAMIGCSRVHDQQKTQDNRQYLHQTRQLMLEYVELLDALKGSSARLPVEGAPRKPGGKTMGFVQRWKTRIGQALASLQAIDNRSASTADQLARLETEVAGLSAELRRVGDRAAASEGAAQNAANYAVSNHFFIGDLRERSLLLQGRVAAASTPDSLDSLADAEFRVFSQWGEDGIIDWLARHVPVPNNRFVEFGVENFREANCRFLLQNRNWRGLVMDGSAQHMASLKAESLYWMFDVTAKTAFIDAENINTLIKEAGFAGPLGILSVDIDGNDYWVWKAIDCVDAAIVITEYNPIFGDTAAITLPYKPDFNRFDGHHSGLYFGSSLAAMISLGKQKGYTFVGTNSNGINAFFVRNDLAHHVTSRLKAVRSFPSRHRDSRDQDGQLCFTGGIDRFTQLKDLPVINVETGKTIRLKDIKKPYSDAWLDAMS
jgi:GT2 family glycosyltransferase